jgi:Flp pilus assembly protein TadG
MRRRAGTSMIEMMAGALILIPIVLLAVDGAYVMICSKANQELADHASRIAANKALPAMATTAATNTVAAYRKTENIDSVKIERMDFDTKRKIVTVVTIMDVRVPVPFPGMAPTRLTAQSIHPIVAIPAER